ncbi:MAG TPA: hydrolase [Pelomicrobium sp.]|nr:hydrolase [Pelomicrobium sp.]
MAANAIAIDRAGFVAPFWLAGGHLQTVYAATLCPTPRVAFRRERLETADADFIDLDWVDGDGRAPVVVLFHGLEGCSRSHYALALMDAVSRRGWRGAVAHFRGCSGELNRLPRFYHSGDTDHVAFTLERVRARAGGAPVFAAGVSLGGNALLKWLGEGAAAAAPDAAAGVSVPLDLAAAGYHLEDGFNRVYTHHFLRRLKRKSLAKLAHHPGLYSAAAVRAARTLHDFDDVVTAPLHGFRDADDYWRRASSKPRLGGVRVPTLVINARDDPFLPAAALPRPDEVSSAVRLEFPAHGGHAGFVSGPFPGHLRWMPERMLAFFAAAVGIAGNALTSDRLVFGRAT